MSEAMKLGNEPVYPFVETGETGERYGLTKLEYAAIAAMQGMLSGRTNASDGKIAHHAVNIAKALLAELSKEQQP